MKRHLSALFVLCALSATLAGCVVEERRPPARPVEEVEIIAPRRPPAPRYEPIPPPPGPAERVVWEPGHWHWGGRDFEWQSGRYVDRPRERERAEYEPGRWVERGDKFVWAPGRWR